MDVQHLILGCRSIEKGDAAKNAVLLEAEGSSSSPEVEVWPIDMSNYASVVAFGKRACGTHSRLDAVILNAGVEYYDFRLAEGIEETLTIHVISTFLLGHLVLPKLLETAKSRSRNTHLTFVGSMIHIFAKTDQLLGAKEGEIFKELSDPAKADMADRYFLGKLLVTLGWCKTELFRNKTMGTGQSVALRMMGRSGEEGARNLVYAASAGEATHGKYLSECQVKSESSFVRSEVGSRAQERLGQELRGLMDEIHARMTA